MQCGTQRGRAQRAAHFDGIEHFLAAMRNPHQGVCSGWTKLRFPLHNLHDQTQRPRRIDSGVQQRLIGNRRDFVHYL